MSVPKYWLLIWREQTIAYNVKLKSEIYSCKALGTKCHIINAKTVLKNMLQQSCPFFIQNTTYRHDRLLISQLRNYNNYRTEENSD